MSKTKHKYRYEHDDWSVDDYQDSNKVKNKKTKRRLDRALKTKNVDELLDMYNNGYDGK